MNFLRRWLRFLFAASDKEVNGIIVLSLIVLLLLVVQILVRNRNTDHDFILTQKLLDSITAQLNPEQPLTNRTFQRPEYPFDPNKAPAQKWIKLGLDSILAYRVVNYLDKGGSFYEGKDLLKIYGFPNDFYDSISPYLAIPPSQITKASKPIRNQYEKDQKINTKNARNESIALIDLNTSDSITFLKLKGIGPYRASTIIKYRGLLGGYYSLDQLLEVYGLDSAIVRSISSFLKIDTIRSPLDKLEINQCDFKVLVHHPYLKYAQVQAILNFRRQHNSINERDFQSFPFLTTHEKLRLIPYIQF